MSIEIEEDYEKLNGFYFLLTYVYFLCYLKDKADLRTKFNRIKDMCKEVIRSKGRVTRISNPSIT